MDLRRFFFRAGNTIPIATLLGPGLGRVDGTAAMYEEEGYIFLFNPSPRIHNASLVVDESLGADGNRPVCATFRIKTDHFAQAGSGQTRETLRSKGDVFCRSDKRVQGPELRGDGALSEQGSGGRQLVAGAEA
jgi:hypothetical protein